jgi:hypothetical protein
LVGVATCGGGSGGALCAALLCRFEFLSGG